MIQFQIEDFGVIKQLEQLPKKTQDEFDSMTSRFGWWVINDLRSRVPVVSGNLKNSLNFEVKGQGSPDQEIGFTGADYFKYLDDGTGKWGPTGSRIQAKGTVMAFAQHGQMWFHPSLDGIKPRKYTDKTFLVAIPESTRHLQEMGNRVFESPSRG